MISPSVNDCQGPIGFTNGKKKIHMTCNMLRGMVTSSELKETLCDRIMLLQEASQMPKGKFGDRVGLTSQMFSNISNYRNPPSHDVIRKAAQEFGIPTEWFYFGSMSGFRDEKLADRVRALEARPRHPD